MISFSGILVVLSSYSLFSLVTITLANTEETLSPPFSLLLFCPFLLRGKLQKPQATVTAIGPIRESSSPWYICSFGLLPFFAFFREERLSYVWSVLNHSYTFWIFSLLMSQTIEESPCCLPIHHGDLFLIKLQGVEMFLISGCSFWLGHIWHFAVQIYAPISELSF